MTLPKSTYDDLQQKGPQYRNMRMYSKIYINDYSEEQFRRTKRSYYANMTLIDEKIGEVLDILKSMEPMIIRLSYTPPTMAILWVIMDWWRSYSVSRTV